MFHAQGDNPRLADSRLGSHPGDKFLHGRIVAIQRGQHQPLVGKQFTPARHVSTIRDFQPMFLQYLREALTRVMIRLHDQGTLRGMG
jgi:hypothetical protein